MTYDETVNYIMNTTRYGKASGCEVTFEMMEYMGHPEGSMKIIHIAGTNGKGSVSAFLTSILMKIPGIKVGTFTSPHLVDFRERIRVNGEMIPKRKVIRYGQYLMNLPLRLAPTMFDYCLGIAILYFKECGCDFIVLETGLGGAKDSTRGLMTTPIVSIVTNIGLEHTEILGDTIEKIAAEKAGIIREGTTAVFGNMNPLALKVLEEKCDELGVKYGVAAPIVGNNTRIGLFGKYQRENAAVAVVAVREIGAKYPELNITEELISEGLADARWMGRMEVVSENPFILLDGAHNPHGVKALCESLKEAFPDEKFTVICCVMKDKDYQSMTGEELLGGLAERFITVDIDYGRVLPREEFADYLKAQGYAATPAENAKTAITLAKKYSEKIVICGSLYFIGEVEKIIGER